MDDLSERLRIHDYTALQTLGLVALYNRIGLLIDDAHNKTQSADSQPSGVYASPETPQRQRKHRDTPNGETAGRSSSIDITNGRKRKSGSSRLQSPESSKRSFEVVAGNGKRNMKSAFARVQARAGDEQTDIDGGALGRRAYAAGRGAANADRGLSVAAVETRPAEYGEVWFDRYQIVGKLGEGAFSQAFLAMDLYCTRMGRRHDGTRLVSIKRMAAHEEVIGLSEHRTLTMLNALDPRGRVPIVRVHDMFRHGVHACLVMEPLLGGTLHDAFPRRVKAAYAAHDTEVARRVHMDMIRAVVRQLLAALTHMHSSALIHADIKTTNVICGDAHSLSAKLIDFGNAVGDGDVAEYYRSFEIQTVWFRAPEVAYQRPFGRAIDVWSVGCVMCELWLGRPLFTDMENRSLVRSMLKLRGPPPAALYAASPIYTDAMRAWSAARPTPGFRAPEPSLDWGAPLRAQWLRHSLHVGDDADADDFIALADALLDYDPEQRPTAAEALRHAFFDGTHFI
ncbi:hypothetical protein LPJ66_001850 [Kickxella alabastrina]|uniref:Uncharacterized protein n=1 Tax=Kickxella alabastrina TaxID=61397 RepID=A0ACC1IS21_9FUNG|nr:hypothetical protein LPJ66_001850 [Kickxella alabastrina]